MTAHIDEHAQHAIYAPSSAHRWTVCTASAEAIARLPAQDEGEEAAKGTAAHEEIERCLGPLNGVPTVSADQFATLTDQVDKSHPSSFGIALVLDFARQIAATSLGRFWIEQRVALTEQIWGRCDVAHWNPLDSVLTIIDYKDGFVGVDAEKNEQLRIYAAASIYTHKLPAKWIRYAIVQPNDFRPVPRVKQWMESADSLFQFAERTAAIPAGPKQFIAGEQCTYCPLFGRCEATRDLLKDVGALVAGLMSPEDVKPAQRALFKACEKPIKDAFAKADKVWMKDALANGAPEGMKIVTSTKHRAWQDANAARALVLERLGADALDPPTPAQAIERGIPEDVVNTMAPRPDGAPVLAFASDKRPEWKQKSAAEMFAGVTGR